MVFPVPSPDALADAQSAELEEALRIAPDGSTRIVDARSPRSPLAAIARTNAMVLYGVHSHLDWIARQVMPDTATDWLERQGSIWGVPRRAAIAAVGEVIFTGTNGTVLPIGTALTLSGTQWLTTAAATIAAGTATVAIAAVSAGVAGNAPAGQALALVSPLLGLTAQQAVVAAGGITGGADIEDDDSWRTRIVEKIREPAHGGAAFDYVRWAEIAIAPARMRTLPAWVGAGSVGFAFLMPDATAGVRVPTAPEIAALDAALQQEAPVTAEVVTLGGTLVPTAITVQVSPGTASVIASVQAAITAYMLSPEIGLGEPLRRSRLSEAISAATGESWHLITAPAADVTPSLTQMLTLGALTVTAAP